MLDFGSDSDSDGSEMEEGERADEEEGATVDAVLTRWEKRLGFAVGGEAQRHRAASSAPLEDFPILSSHERSMRHKYTKSVFESLAHTKKCGQCSGMSPR